MSQVAIVGAGFSGAVIARELAEAGIRCDVFDSRSHVAGNCHTERDPDEDAICAAVADRIAAAPWVVRRLSASRVRALIDSADPILPPGVVLVAGDLAWVVQLAERGGTVVERCDRLFSAAQGLVEKQDVAELEARWGVLIVRGIEADEP